MPTQTTPSSAGTLRDAAGPGHIPSPPLAPGVTTAVMPDTGSGSRVTWPRGIFIRVARYWREFQERRRSYVELSSLSTRELQDIGITSAEVDQIVARRAIDRLRDGTAYPGMR